MRQDAQKNQQKIIVKTRQLFSKVDDINQVSMKEIAKNAKVGVGTLYRNFPTKGALCLALIYDDLRNFININQQKILNSDITLTTLHSFLHEYLQFRDHNLDLLAIIESNADSFYTTSFALYQKLSKLLFTILSQVFPEKSSQELYFKTDMTFAMLKSDIYVFERKHRHLSNDKYLQFLLKMICN